MILTRYYDALENGTADQLRPDPLFRGELPDPAVVIKALDEEFHYEMRIAHVGAWRGFDGEPEFERLLNIAGGAPAVAMVQELALLYRDPNMVLRPAPVSVSEFVDYGY